MIEQYRAKGEQTTRLVLDATEKANIYSNDVYPKNQHIHLKPRDELFSIQYNPVDGLSVPYLWCVLRKCDM